MDKPIASWKCTIFEHKIELLKKLKDLNIVAFAPLNVVLAPPLVEFQPISLSYQNANEKVINTGTDLPGLIESFYPHSEGFNNSRMNYACVLN